METTQASRKIVLLGDLALHTMVERDTNPHDANTQPYRGYRRSASSPLLPAMIGEALMDGLVASTEGLVIPDYASVCASPNGLEASCGELISILDLFPEGSASRRDQRTKLRVRSEYLIGPVHSDSAASKPPHERLKGLLQKIDPTQLGDGHLLVLYDHGGLLRKGLTPAEGEHAPLAALRDLVAGASSGIVIGVNGDLRNLAWLDALRPALADARRQRTVLLVTADNLRKEGLKIARYGPLEDTVKDIFNNREQPPLQSLFTLADHLVVVFSETGGLYIDHSGGRWKGSLHFCPNFDRYAQANSAVYGFMPGKFAIFLVALVKELYRVAKGGTGDLDVGSAIRLGTVAYNRHFTQGLARGRKPDGGGFDPYAAFEAALSPQACADLKEAVRNPQKRSLLVSSLRFEEAELRADWSRTSSLLATTGLRARLHAIVERGLDAELVEKEEAWRNALAQQEKEPKRPWFPLPYITVPYSAMGQLRLLDHREIANHYSLAKVIRKYLETKRWDTPLSIGVFGDPGSGKSFGVRQILDTVDPGRKSKPLTFNLAQFSTVDHLTEAFHQIQDRALSSDEVPLAIFDEFDASFGEWRLGWLKYFLAPMQDGLFRGSAGDYKVGRAIFLFAGGTSTSFADFCAPLALLPNMQRLPTSKTPTEQADLEKLTERDVRGFKLADFASRLRGYLDISPLSDANYDSARGVTAPIQLRRAVILRSLLEKLAEPILISSHEEDVKQARIHPKVIDAFLEQPNYLHGVRSMEAIIQMSRWIDDEFVPASLPSEDLLKAHVAREFLPPMR